MLRRAIRLMVDTFDGYYKQRLEAVELALDGAEVDAGGPTTERVERLLVREANARRDLAQIDLLLAHERVRSARALLVLGKCEVFIESVLPEVEADLEVEVRKLLADVKSAQQVQ